MRLVLLSALFCASLCAQSPSIVVHDPTGRTPDTPLAASGYQFPDTPASSSSSLVLRIANPSSTPIEVITPTLSNGNDFNSTNPNFTITGVFLDKVLAPNSANFEEFTVNFTPQSTGTFFGVLQATYLVQQSGGTYSGTPSQANFSTLQGNGLPPTLVLSYSGPNGSGVLQPNTPNPLNFGNISTGATSTISFTLANQTPSALTTPTISLQTGVYFSSAFSSTASQLPSSIPANSSVSFNVTFAPGQTGLTSATLLVGQNSYPLSGTGVIVADTDALQISYVDSTGARLLPQAATPINVTQVSSSPNGNPTLTFSVTNPAISFNAITLPSLTVTGAGFAIAHAPTLPVSIAPGSAITFDLVFSAPGTGTYNGTLSIGPRQFSVTARGASSAIPSVSFQVDQAPLMSQQQAHLSLQLSSPAPAQLIPTLTMEFTPLVSGITDDPAINFVTSGSRQLQITFASGSQAGTFNGQSALTFQTGTTAGTFKFTLAFADGTKATQSFTIPPSAVQITTSQALRQAPYLVLNLTGYDNTYSVGNMVFNFYDAKGKLLTPNGISVEAGSSFHQFFFNNNQTGGAFTLQAKFPVTGDVTTVSSVAVAVANSVQATNVKANFQ